MNRTYTYVAYDGLGKDDPAESDFRYYGILQDWAKDKDIEFKIANSHEKTNAARDAKKKKSLLDKIDKRLRESKNMIVILSKDTRKRGSILSHEIKLALDKHKLPLILVYIDYVYIEEANNELSGRWPVTLQDRIDREDTRAVHMGFKREPVLNAIEKCTVQNDILVSGREVYTRRGSDLWEIDTILNESHPE